MQHCTPDEYPDHRQARKAALAQANHQCQECGAIHGQTVRQSERTGNLWVAYLQLVHPDHDPWNPNARTSVMCNGCHMGKDGPMHAQGARHTRTYQQASRGRYQRHSIANGDIVRIARRLGVTLTYEPSQEGGWWHWQSAVTTGTFPTLADAFEQALFDLLRTAQEQQEAHDE